MSSPLNECASGYAAIYCESTTATRLPKTFAVYLQRKKPVAGASSKFFTTGAIVRET